MAHTARMIEVDEATATAIENRAVQRGMNVSDFLAELIGADAQDSAAVAELDRRWARAKSGKTVANEDVVAWLDNWGTPEFQPWRAL